MEKCNVVRTLIESGADISDVSRALSELNVKETDEYWVEGTNRCWWDLMHFAVYANRRDVIECMFAKGFFLSAVTLPPYEFYHLPLHCIRRHDLPYSHMACVLGSMDIVDVILQHRPLEKDLRLTCGPHSTLDRLKAVAEQGND